MSGEEVDVKEITSMDDLTQYDLYHVTHRNNTDEIFSKGFNPVVHAEGENHDRFLQIIAEKYNIECPVDRSNSTFFYSQYYDAERRFHAGIDRIIVIDTRFVTNMVIGDMEIYTKFMRHVGIEENYDDLEKEAIRLGKEYLHSLSHITPEMITGKANSMKVPEVIIKGHLSKRAIKGVIYSQL